MAAGSGGATGVPRGGIAPSPPRGGEAHVVTRCRDAENLAPSLGNARVQGPPFRGGPPSRGGSASGRERLGSARGLRPSPRGGAISVGLGELPGWTAPRSRTGFETPAGDAGTAGGPRLSRAMRPSYAEKARRHRIAISRIGKGPGPGRGGFFRRGRAAPGPGRTERALPVSGDAPETEAPRPPARGAAAPNDSSRARAPCCSGRGCCSRGC
jgi:hypothetical protein